jgi:hypothetical protein
VVCRPLTCCVGHIDWSPPAGSCPLPWRRGSAPGRCRQAAGGGQPIGPATQPEAVELQAVELQEAGQHLLGIGEGLFGAIEIGLPGCGIPHLDPAVGANDHTFLGQAGVIA